MHILTFDIEDWFHVLDNDLTKTETQWAQFKPRIGSGTDRILQLLADKKARATFFCLGWIAKTHPDIVKKIYSAGHEIGSHSYSHQLVHKGAVEQFRQDTLRSIGVLEDLTGTKVRAYRAPGFSITDKNPWAFSVLAELGIEFDSSVFVGKHAHGGFENFRFKEPVLIEHQGMVLKEFPLTAGCIGGMRIVCVGGGYFRLLPYQITRCMLKRGNYAMTYFHPRDFDPDQPTVPGLKWDRVFRSYVGVRSSIKKLHNLLSDFRFMDIRTADLQINWASRPAISISSKDIALKGDGPAAQKAFGSRNKRFEQFSDTPAAV